MNEFWKKPARLWCRRSGESARSAQGAIRQLDGGSLEAMVRAAVDAEAMYHAGSDTLFVDVEAKRMLSIGEIRRLRGSPDFPVEI